MELCTAKLVICSIISVAAIVGTSSAVLRHPKLRRCANSLLQNSSTASFIVVWKDVVGPPDNSTSRNVTASDLMWKVQAGSGDGGNGEAMPMIENATDNGIGVTADMNEAALERVSALEWCV